MPAPEAKLAVAVVLLRRGKVGMFRRSMAVGHDGGLWHCITGHLPSPASALAQAMEEVFEEAGLSVAQLEEVRTGPILALTGDDGVPWEVHTFAARTLVRTLTLNWEHDAYRWVKPYRVAGFTHVHWLSAVMAALGPFDRASGSPSDHEEAGERMPAGLRVYEPE
jgi:8-oxo-dGTP pyrophosphatase MutT (NUDIX family)